MTLSVLSSSLCVGPCPSEDVLVSKRPKRAASHGTVPLMCPTVLLIAFILAHSGRALPGVAGCMCASMWYYCFIRSDRWLIQSLAEPPLACRRSGGQWVSLQWVNEWSLERWPVPLGSVVHKVLVLVVAPPYLCLLQWSMPLHWSACSARLNNGRQGRLIGVL